MILLKFYSKKIFINILITIIIIKILSISLNYNSILFNFEIDKFIE